VFPSSTVVLGFTLVLPRPARGCKGDPGAGGVATALSPWNSSIPGAPEVEGACMRKFFIGLAIGLVACTYGVVKVNSHRADRVWQEMLVLGDEIQNSIDGADAHRPVLHGVGLDGNAHDDYALAVSLLSPTADDDWLACREAFERGDEDAIALRDTLLDDHEAMLRALTQGAHRTTAQYPMQWDRGFYAEIPRLLGLRTLTNIAVLEAKRHLDGGRPDQAVEILLDGMQFSRDHCNVPLLISSMIGCALLNITGRGALIDDGLLDRIPRTSLGKLADGMRTLDEGLSMTSDAHAGEVVMFVRTIEHAESLDALFDFDLDDMLRSWRYGFSDRHMLAASVHESANRLAILRESDGAPWPARQRTLQELHEMIEQSSDPITQVAAPKVLSAVESLYGAQTRFRLARAAVEYRLSGRIPHLADPFGDEFRITESDGVVRVESAGPGHDHGAELYAIELVSD